MEELEAKLSRVGVSEEEESRSSSPGSDHSDASGDFYSADEETTEDLTQQSHSKKVSGECSEGGDRASLTDVPVIEPDGGDGSLPASPHIPPTQEGETRLQEEEEEEDDEHFVDEEYLKDIELTMDEEEKQSRREQSLQHKEVGNSSFKTGQYAEALTEYTAGLRLCPVSCHRDRAVLYANRAAAKSKINMKKEAIHDCNKAIEYDDTYLKAILRRATLNEETEQLDEALKDFQRVVELDPGHQEAHQALQRLPDMITEKNEKLKEEMMGKLKDLGNMVLGHFGLSTNNFEFKQDPNSGGYNINFRQNPPNT